VAVAVISEAALRGHYRRGRWLLGMCVLSFGMNVWGATSSIIGGPSAVGAWFQPLAVVMNMGVAVWMWNLTLEIGRQQQLIRSLLDQQDRMRRLFG